jgi:hypothetical protein
MQALLAVHLPFTAGQSPPVCVAQCAECLVIVPVSRPNVGHHDGLGVATQAVLQEPRQLGVTVGDVACTHTAAKRRHMQPHIAECKQGDRTVLRCPALNYLLYDANLAHVYKPASRRSELHSNNLWLQGGCCCSPLLPSTSALMTLPSALRDRLILVASLSLSPAPHGQYAYGEFYTLVQTTYCMPLAATVLCRAVHGAPNCC